MSATAAQAFFNPTTLAGLLTGWEIQTDQITTSRQRAQALGAEGDEIASQLFDQKTTISIPFVATSASAAVPKAGQIIGGFHIDSVTVNFSNTAFVTMTLAGHKHGSSNHSACRTYTGSLTTIGVMFGCPAAPLGFATLPTGAGVRSYTYTLTTNHVDELGSQGNYLASDNYDGTETAEIELCDTCDVAADTTIPSDSDERAVRPWTLVTNGHNRGNTQAEASSGTVERHIKHDTSNP